MLNHTMQKKMKKFENICCNRSGICYSRGTYETKPDT